MLIYIPFFLYLKRLSAMEKGQCPTVANWESGNVRSRKATPTSVTTPGQVIFQIDFVVKMIFN